jgi:hypothetical protein
MLCVHASIADGSWSGHGNIEGKALRAWQNEDVEFLKEVSDGSAAGWWPDNYAFKTFCISPQTNEVRYDIKSFIRRHPFG